MKNLLLCILVLSLSSCANQSSKGSDEKGKASTNCLQLNLSKGFQSDGDWDLALHCAGAQDRFPQLVSYLDQVSKTIPKGEIRKLTNQILEVQNLKAATELFSRWEGRLSSATLDEFGRATEPLFSSEFLPRLIPSFRALASSEAGQNLILQGLQMAAQTFSKANDAEVMRLTITQWLDLPETPHLFQALRKLTETEDTQGNLLFHRALQQSVELAASGKWASFLTADQSFRKGKTFRELVHKVSSSELEAVWNLLQSEGLKFHEVAEALSSINWTLACGPNKEIPYPEKASLLFLRRVAMQERSSGFAREIQKRWPEELCGITRKNLNILLQLEEKLLQNPDRPPMTWFKLAIDNGEEELLVNWVAKMAESGFDLVWLPWLSATIENRSLYDFVDLWNKSGSAPWFIPLNALPTIVLVISLTSDDFIDQLRPLFDPEPFRAIRALALALWDQKEIPKSFLDITQAVLKSRLPETFSNNPPTPTIFSQGLKLLMGLKEAFSR